MSKRAVQKDTYGFVEGQGENIFRIDTEKKRVVRLMFDLCLDRMNLGQIKGLIEAQGILYPAKYKKDTPIGWLLAEISKILSNMFASAFLLPKDSFVRTVAAYPTNIDYYKFLKKKWKVSMQAMMYRARQLNVISSNQFQYMMRIVSKNGWRTKEPGDVPGRMGDTIFQGAIDLLFDGGYMTVDELLRDFASYGIILSQKDLKNSMCLREGNKTRLFDTKGTNRILENH